MTVVATGGSISYAGGKKIHTFTTNGTFTVSVGGDIELLMVAGGASGGVGLTPPYYGGGGGAGGVIYDASLTVAPSNMAITIGQGGAAKSSLSDAKGNNGTNTVLSDGAVLIGTLTAIGGGAGAGFGAGNEPNSGGSGGGGTYNAGGAAGTSGQGYKGGDGGGFAQGPAGGGGAGAEGGNYSIGDGGVGLEYSISGVAKYYAGGGAGAGGSVRTGVGGLGGGGDWGEAASYYGGGGSGNYTGGTVSFAGFQGIVIISYAVAGTTGRRVWQNEDGGDMAAGTIKGRITSTGIPQDLTVAQVGSILINGLSADTLADADEFSFWKAASSTLKKITWVNIKATLKTYFDTLYVALNAPITGATKTKITYDAKGLVTAGADATTADIADSTNKRYVTDADLIDIGNLSGTNTGDQDLSGYGLKSGTLAQFAATTSAQLAGVLSDETGTGAAVFATSPTLVTPLLGTPTSGVLTNVTGLPLTTGVTGILPVANGGSGISTVFDGWIATAWAGLTRSSDTVFTTTTNVSAIIQKGTKLKVTDTSFKYFVVISATWNGSVTTITTIANTTYTIVANPSAVSYSFVELPTGWPSYFNYTTTHSRAGTNYTNAPSTIYARWQCRQNILTYLIVYLQNATPGGTGGAQFTIPVTPGDAHICFATNISAGTSCQVIFNGSATGVLTRYDGAASADANNYYSSNGEVRF